jgi:hypothetical protein
MKRFALPFLLLSLLLLTSLVSAQVSTRNAGDLLLEVGKIAGPGGLITMESRELMNLMEDQRMVREHDARIKELALLKKGDEYFLEARGRSQTEELRARVQLYKLKDRLLLVSKSEIELCVAPIGCTSLGFNAEGPGCFCKELGDADAIYYARDGELRLP